MDRVDTPPPPGKLSIISKSGESGWSGALTLHKIHETDGDLTGSLSISCTGGSRHSPISANLRSGNAGGRPTRGRRKARQAVRRARCRRQPERAGAQRPLRGESGQGDPPRRRGREKVRSRKTPAVRLPGTLRGIPGDEHTDAGGFFHRTSEGLFTINHAPGSYKLSILGGAGLDAAFGADKALAADAALAVPHARARLRRGLSPWPRPMPRCSQPWATSISRTRSSRWDSPRSAKSGFSNENTRTSSRR